MKVALLGAAGATGKAIGAALSEAGIEARAVGRSEARLRAAFGGLRSLECLSADLETQEGAHLAARGVDTVAMTLGLPTPSSPAMLGAVHRTSYEDGIRGTLRLQ